MIQKILMVCLGNICRSPLAEGILNSKLSDNYFIDSAGTGNWHIGEKPDRRSVQIAKKYGIDISSQRARQISATDLDDFDLIFSMDYDNYNKLLKMSQSEFQKSKIKMIMEKDIPDPYYGDEKDFEIVFNLLDLATDQIIELFDLS